MRHIKYIVLHCTASPQTQTVDQILAYWKRPVAQGGKGWLLPGYHLMIPPNGVTRRLLDDAHPSNGVAGHNLYALHVSYIGGVDAHGNPTDNRTPAQIAEQIRIIRRWLAQFPDAEVLGHRDFPGVTKACPSFNARDWWATVK
jgi:N-acetylmuramoyl-L-alanine amidase